MGELVRHPVMELSIDGQSTPRAISARITKGLNQRYSTAEAVMPWPFPSWLRQWSAVHINGGGSIDQSSLRFNGRFLDPTIQHWLPRGQFLFGSELSRAENWHPPVINSLAGLTDIEAIELILDNVGVPHGTIEGHGKRIADVTTAAVTWDQGTDAISMIDQIDRQVGLGYRLFDDGLQIIRKFIPLSPNSLDPVYTFTTGENCFNMTMRRTRIKPAGLVTINGDGVSATGSSGIESNLPNTPYTRQWLMIQQQAFDEDIVSAEEVSLFMLAKMTRNLISVTVPTWIDRRFAPGDVVMLRDPILTLSQVFYVQQAIESWEGAQYRQLIECISELDERENEFGTPIGTVNPGTSTTIPPIEPLPPSEFPPVTPPAPSLTAGFVISAIDKEKAVIDDEEVDVWLVYAVDSSSVTQGTIDSYAWTASGPVLTGWESGTGPEFVTAFTSLVGAVITLEVEANGGDQTGERSVNVEASPGVVQKTLEIFLAATTEAEAWAPATSAFNVDAQSAAEDVVDVANGPYWGLPVTTNEAMRSTDYLATSAAESSIAFTDGSVSGVRSWIEPDVDDQLIGVIGTNGQVAFSSDAGENWTVKDGPGGAGKDIIISRFVPGQVHVLTDTGWHISDNYGDSWRVARELTDGKWLTLSHSRNMIVTTDGDLETAEPSDPGDVTSDGVAQTGTSDIVTAAAHIRQDRFVALTSDSHVWRTEDDGGTVLEDLGAIPGGPVHMYRHGSIPDFYVYAAGTDGAYKLIIRTNAGPTYDVKTLQIRKPGIGTSNAVADYQRVGVGRMVDAHDGGSSYSVIAGTGFNADGLYGKRLSDGVWEQITGSGIGTTTQALEVVTPVDTGADGSRVYLRIAGSPDTYLVSNDGGATWSTMALTGVTSGDEPFGLWATTQSDLWFTIGSAGTGPGIWQSTDGGATANLIVTPAAGDQPFGAQASDSRLWWSLNNASSPTVEAKYAALDGSGETSLTTGNVGTFDVAAAIDATTEAFLWGLDGTGPLLRVNGTSISTVTPPTSLTTPRVFGVAVLGTTVLCAVMNSARTSGEIWRSTNSGTAWTMVAGPDATLSPGNLFTGGSRTIAYDPADTTLWWCVGDSGVVWKSTDTGATWTSETVDVAVSSFTCIAVMASGTVP